MRAGDTIDGRFHLEALAGSGGMGSVFLARDLSSGEAVAVKSVEADSSLAQRLRREAAVIAGLSHPAVVTYVAHGTSPEGEPFFAMEWLDGEDLEVRLRRGRLSLQETIALGAAAADGLAAAHAAGVVHRDVKPSNLFLVGGDAARVKLVDFGIARTLGHQGTMTRIGTVLGTPGYMSPEQARGDVELDGRSDVFSLGAVLYECLAGACPFMAEHVMGTLAKLLLADPPRLKDLGLDVMTALDELIAGMLAKDPAKRPQSAAEVARALAELDDAVPTIRTRAPAPEPALTRGEQRLLSLLFVGPPPAGEDPRQALAALEHVARAHGGAVEPFADGSAVVLLSAPAGAGAATDQAARAAEQGLAVRAALPSAIVVLATGRGIVASRTPAPGSGAARPGSPPVMGEVIDRAVARMRAELSVGRTPGDALAVDEVTAGLLDARFEIAGDAGGLYVMRRSETAGLSRSLLGAGTPFVGREAEMASLVAALDEHASRAAARVVLVTGPAGAGKSRLGMELLRAAVDRGFSVWIGRGDLVKSQAPYGLVGRALAGLAQVVQGEPLGVRRRKLRARVGRHLAPARADHVAGLLGEISGTPMPDEAGGELAVARSNPVLLADLVRRAFCEWLAAECDARPTLLLLEDLQWADLPSVQLVDGALRNLPGARLCVVGLARPELLASSPRLFAERDVREIRLGELEYAACVKLATAVLGASSPMALREAIAARSGGNAFYLEELLRSAREGKGLASLPETVVAMVHARLDAVSPEARRALRAASVFGETFPRSGVAALLGGPESAAEVEACLAELVQKELIVPVASGRSAAGEHHAFRSALVRDSAYAMLVDEDRRRGHVRAGEHLTAAGEPQAVVIAEHFEKGGASERAIEPYRIASLQALAANDFRGAMAHAERAVACGASGKTLGQIRRVEADAAGWAGEIAECRRCARDAMSHLERGGALWVHAAALAGVAEWRLGHLDALRAIAADLIAMTPEQPPASLDADLLAAQAIAVSRIAVASFHAGDLKAGNALLARIRARIGARLLDAHPYLLAFAYRAVAIDGQKRGDIQAALLAVETSSGCFERAGALRDACVDHANCGFFLLELGKNAEAEATLLQALRVADQLGLANVAANTQQNLAAALCRRGALAEASEMALRAQRTYEAQGARRMLTVGCIYLARIELAAGRAEAAEEHARAAVQLAADVAPFRAYANGVLAAALVAAGRWMEAALVAERALSVLASVGAEEGEVFVRLAAAEAFLGVSRHGEADRILAEVREKLLRRAGRLHDAAFKQSFLAGIPENARALALAEERLGGGS